MSHVTEVLGFPASGLGVGAIAGADAVAVSTSGLASLETASGATGPPSEGTEGLSSAPPGIPSKRIDDPEGGRPKEVA